VKWYGVSGSWRPISRELIDDVQIAISNIMEAGDGIVSGGALGVDYIATRKALQHNPKANRIKIIIPASLEIFSTHFRKQAEQGVIMSEQAETLIELLTVIRDKGSLTEMGYTELDTESYYARNSEVVHASNELLAFQVNNSSGTQDTIDKAHSSGKTVTLKQYRIEQ